MSLSRAEVLERHLSMPRFSFKANLSEHMLLDDLTTKIKCISTEVSKYGISITCQSDFVADTIIYLKIPKFEDPIKLIVIWCEANHLNKKLYDIGLEVYEHAHNLMLMLVKSGLLKKKEECLTKHLAPLNYGLVKERLMGLNSHDPYLFLSIEYEGLIGTHNAYPTRIDERSLIVVLPKSMNPGNFSELDSYEAAKKMFILEEITYTHNKNKWVPVWPGYGLLREKIDAEKLVKKNAAVNDLDEEFEV